jgi:hypothetical protein
MVLLLLKSAAKSFFSFVYRAPRVRLSWSVILKRLWVKKA